MTLSLSRLTDLADEVDKSTFSTPSVSPTGNRLILVSIAARVVSGSVPAITSVSGGGMTTWTEVLNITYETSLSRTAVYRALQASPGSGAVTVTWPSDVTVCNVFVHEWAGCDTSGTNGSGAVVQSNSVTGTGTSGTVTLSAFGSSNNYAHLLIPHRVFFEGATAGGGMTLEGNIGADGITFHSLYGANQASPSASWTTSSAYGGIALEIKAAADSVPLRSQHLDYDFSR